MNGDQLSDAELGGALRDVAKKTVFSPEALLTFAAIVAEDHKRTVLPSQFFTSKKEGGVEYHAKLISEFTLDEGVAVSLPEWAAPLIGKGIKIEHWQWDDGVAVLRLVNSRGVVIGGKTL